MSPYERWHALVAYLEAKLHERDWHGVRDAAVDLEVLEARHPDIQTRKPSDRTREYLLAISKMPFVHYLIDAKPETVGHVIRHSMDAENWKEIRVTRPGQIDVPDGYLYIEVVNGDLHGKPRTPGGVSVLGVG